MEEFFWNCRELAHTVLVLRKYLGISGSSMFGFVKPASVRFRLLRKHAKIEIASAITTKTATAIPITTPMPVLLPMLVLLPMPNVGELVKTE